MKKILVFILLLSIAFNMYPENSDREIFRNGITCFSKKEYDRALKYFIEMKNKGYDNFELNYNIASCYYKMEKLGYSRFYFERALFFKPFDRNLMSNLKLIYSKVLTDPVIGEQEIMNKRMIFFIPLAVLSALIVLLAVSTAVFLFIFFKRKNLRRLSLVFIIVSLSLMLLFTFAFMLQYHDFHKKIYVITSNSANIYLLPNESETVLNTVNEGNKGDVISINGDYAKIRLMDGSDGWVKRNDIIVN
jgi:hypothetical protein